MKRMAAVVCLLAVAGLVRAEDKADPTGTWKYKANVDGQSIDITIKLELKAGKLTGTVSVLDTQAKIEDARYKDGEVSFTVHPEVNGNKLTVKYRGRIQGDTFKGKRELERNGETNTREFDAKRATE